ncbi:hypothetical protein [Rhizobium sp. G21]|uniref:hypothetical protein n=1 Tax=Rhizobium sp. G21 TaxID=2758439 RepID=UPI0016014EEE|nr:hypothetical protein [Rhizobium sp. G21]MBB1249148.1 hypothetical protein [Rhizobium sp. G21]
MTLGKHPEVVETAAVSRSARPFRQGSLDAYCGFYSIANAMLKIKPEAFDDAEGTLRLVRTMMRTAARICAPEELVHEGMDGVELDYVAKAAIRHMRRIGHNFRLVRPSRLGLGPLSRDPAKWFADAAAVTSIAVILHIDKNVQSHWSVLSCTKGNRLVLFDSDQMKSAKIVQCQPHLAIARCPVQWHPGMSR